MWSYPKAGVNPSTDGYLGIAAKITVCCFGILQVSCKRKKKTVDETVGLLTMIGLVNNDQVVRKIKRQNTLLLMFFVRFPPADRIFKDL